MLYLPKIDLEVSLHVPRSIGDEVSEGEEIARAYLRRADAALEKDLRACFTVADRAEPAPLVRGRIHSPALNELTSEEPFWF